MPTFTQSDIVGGIIVGISKGSISMSSICTSRHGMYGLDSEGFGWRITSYLNNTTYSNLFSGFNAFYLVQFRSELMKIRVEDGLLSGFGELETELSHF